MNPTIDYSHQEVDYLVIGAGAAGFSLALKLAEFGRVCLMAKGDLSESAASRWAQGGIATVLAESDSYDEHAKDTIEAGAGLCHPDIVDMVVRDGPRVIRELAALGAQFTVDPIKLGGEFPYHLTQEGGHSQRRVVHARDWTGAEIMRALHQAALQHPNIEIRSHQFVIDLITTDKYAPDFVQNSCLGAYVLDQRAQDIHLIRSRATFLCTGGHGKVYLYTSNPDSATGDGLAVGARAGCKVANLEFMQFHPTCLYHPAAKNFLISEAVRGEGAELLNRKGEAFAYRYHPLGALAPRDIVARAIDAELKETGEPHVWLDATRIGAERVMQLFPNIHERCLSHGIDISKDPIPVIPAAHYSCGGLITDQNGRTNVHRLYAVGEVACTGLHGANRLASNSLLEALVFAKRVADDVCRLPAKSAEQIRIPPWNKGRAGPAEELGLLLTAWDEIRRLMWNYVGIVRSDARLQLAYDRIVSLRHELDSYYWGYEISERLLEVRNLAQVAYLTIRCAMARKESRGIHYNINYPLRDEEWGSKDTIISQW
jgi:L-aspartate oxidase